MESCAGFRSRGAEDKIGFRPQLHMDAFGEILSDQSVCQYIIKK